MNLSPLSMAHQQQISSLCDSLQIPLSEYNFANLYLFRTTHQYRVLTLNSKNVALVGVTYDHHTFLMPLFHPHDWKGFLHEVQHLNIDMLYPIPEMWFDEIRLQGCTISFLDTDSDYLYDASSIKQYRGRHFDGHRNAIRQLRADHEITVVPLNVQTRDSALHVIDEWAKGHTTEQQQYEAQVCREAVQMAEELHLEGWLFEVDAVPRGLLIGAPLTSDTYCFHFEKSHRAFRGLPAYMYQTVAKNLDSKYLYMNWEQDLGCRGLRQAKESYRPIRKATKGRIVCS